jgi:hypothetical protein
LGLEELDKEIDLIFATPTPLLPTASASESFVLKKGLLSTIAKEQDEPEVIADNVKDFMLSEDKNKLAWWTANEVWVMWLNDAGYQPYHKKGDKELITRFSTQIKKAAWFMDEDHLIIDSSGYKILEIDTRGGINIIEI